MIFLILLYIAIASASIFGLVVFAEPFREYDSDTRIGWVLCGIFWPLAGLPAAAYLAARWYTENKN